MTFDAATEGMSLEGVDLVRRLSDRADPLRWFLVLSAAAQRKAGERSASESDAKKDREVGGQIAKNLEHVPQSIRGSVGALGLDSRLTPLERRTP